MGRLVVYTTAAGSFIYHSNMVHLSTMFYLTVFNNVVIRRLGRAISNQDWNGEKTITTSMTREIAASSNSGSVILSFALGKFIYHQISSLFVLSPIPFRFTWYETPTFHYAEYISFARTVYFSIDMNLSLMFCFRWAALAVAGVIGSAITVTVTGAILNWRPVSRFVPHRFFLPSSWFGTNSLKISLFLHSFWSLYLASFQSFVTAWLVQSWASMWSTLCISSLQLRNSSAMACCLGLTRMIMNINDTVLSLRYYLDNVVLPSESINWADYEGELVKPIPHYLYRYVFFAPSVDSDRRVLFYLSISFLTPFSLSHVYLFRCSRFCTCLLDWALVLRTRSSLSDQNIDNADMKAINDTL